MIDSLISVVVPIYNQEAYLYRCVDSLINQTYKKLEIILVDDGSTDTSGVICENYAKKDPRIVVIHTQNRGLSCARNSGIEAAHGEYIGFVDSDDWVEVDMYEKLLKACIRNNTQVAIGGRYDVDKRGLRTKGYCPIVNEVKSMEDTMRAILEGEICDSAVWDKLYKKNLFEDIRFPSGKYYEDIAVTYQILLKCSQVSFVNEIFYNYVHHGSGITASKNIKYAIDYCEHAKILKDTVSKQIPQLYEECFFIRIHALSFFLRRYEDQEKSIKLKYLKKAASYRKELLDCRKIWLKNKMFTFKQKLLYLILSLNLYRFVKSI